MCSMQCVARIEAVARDIVLIFTSVVRISIYMNMSSSSKAGRVTGEQPGAARHLPITFLHRVSSIQAMDGTW